MPIPAAQVSNRPAVSSGGKRILLATFGSLGDLHPYIAVGRELLRRGHQPVLVSSSAYREKVEGEGIEFHPLRPELPPLSESQNLMRRIMNPGKGAQVILRELIFPHLRDQYEDLAAAAEGADLLVSHVLTFGVRMVAERTGRPWVGTMLQPMMFTSAYEPPTPPHAPHLAFLYGLGPAVNRRLVGMVKRMLQPLTEPVNRLRQELGLPALEHPMLDGQHSPYLNLALFSAELGAPQPDWPRRTVVTGFPFYDRLKPGAGMPEELERFLAAGPPPIVFTLGSSAVMVGANFYTESIRAAQKLGRRAVFLVGIEDWNCLPNPLPEGMIAVGYAPYGELFPRASAVVHQGGVGTTGQAMRAGRPMLVVPFAHDQPDNALRIQRRGLGRMLPQRRYHAASAAAALRRILEDSGYAARAAEVGARVRAEEGVTAACNALEALLATAGDTAPGLRGT
jgi:rhamnosyltransferase subunit B